MAHYTVLEGEQLAAVLARFGLPAPSLVTPEPKGAVNTGYHVWSGGRRYFLRVNEGKTPSEVAFEAEAQRYLHAARFAVPELLSAVDGQAFVEVAGKPAMLFAYAPGEELSKGDVTPERCRRLGEELGRLHELAAGFGPSRPNPFGPAWTRERVERLEPAGRGDAEVAAALPLLREELAQAGALPGAPRGLVHGDLFVDNVLWIGDRVSALLDWEMSCVDPFAYDLGVAVNAWCWTGAFLPERARALLAGYRARRRIEPETVDGLYAWSRYAALRFAVARIHGYVPEEKGGGRLARKDWRTYRDRLQALRSMGEAGHRSLMGI
jgi:homoserine kinase type II